MRVQEVVSGHGDPHGGEHEAAEADTLLQQTKCMCLHITYLMQ